MLVPEINLTPQLDGALRRSASPAGAWSRCTAALTPAQRLRHWLLAHLGQADLVLGTRLAVFASLPRLGLIVVDEEHDPSYKQQEGARYSARDLAVWRGRLESVPVRARLGHAVARELAAAPSAGRYRRLALPERDRRRRAAARCALVDMSRLPQAPRRAARALAPPLLAALRERASRAASRAWCS